MIEITPEAIINATREKIYCNGCKHIGDSKGGEKICYRIVAVPHACAEEVRYYKCTHANKDNECRFYKAKISKKKRETPFLFFLRGFFIGSGIVIIIISLIRLIRWLIILGVL